MKNTKTWMVLAIVVMTGCNQGGGGGKSHRAQATGAAVGTTVLAGALVEARVLHQATSLEDGSVLVTGGETLTSPASTTAELWQAGHSVPLAEAMSIARKGHTAVRLPSGEVWIAGGVDATGTALRSTEVWSPTSRTFRAGPDLREARGGAAICEIGSGIVLAGGGAGVEVWGTDLTPGSSFALPGGEVRVLDRLAQVQPGLLYLAGGVDPATGSPSTPLLIDMDGKRATTAPGAEQVALGAPIAATLDGKTTDVFVVGGTFADKPSFHLQRVRASDTGVVQVLPDVLVSRQRAAVVALGRGILIAGGLQSDQPVQEVELVLAEGSSFAQPLGVPRFDLVATKLPGGAVLFTGGRGRDGLPLALTELLVPPGAAAPDGAALFARARQDRSEREALEASRDAAQAEVARLEAALEDSEDALAAERAKTARLEQDLAAARARVAALEGQVAGLTTQLQQTQAQVGQLQADLQTKRSELAQVQQDAVRLQAQLDGRDAAVKQLEQEKQALAQQLQAEQAKASQAAAQAAALQGQVSGLQSQVTTLQAQKAPSSGSSVTTITKRHAVSYAPGQLGFQINGLHN